MAKRRDDLLAMSADKAAGAQILTLKCVKEFSVSLGGIRRLKDDQGRVYKHVALLRCRCRVAGMLEPIESEIEMEAAEGWGVAGELDACFAPALRTFLDQVAAAYVAKLKKEQQPLPGTIQPFANPDGTIAKPPKPGAVESVRRTHAMQQSQSFFERKKAEREAEKLEKARAAAAESAEPEVPAAEPENAEVNHAG